MENYTEWYNNKLYEGHVRRLTQIKQKQKKMAKTLKNFRIKSQPSKSQQNIKKQFMPLPLVSKDQRVLLGQVVKVKTMNLKQKQSLLQNYLLSKRILETHSVFDSKLLKKQFIFHRKVSQNMNRNLKQNRKTFSELRKKSKYNFKVEFSQLQKIRQQNYLGVGRVLFAIKINQIMIIKRKLEENNESRFNLIYKPEKFKSYSIKALAYTDLIQKKHHFKATKKQIQKQYGLKFQIQEVRGNDLYKLGEFRLHIQHQNIKMRNDSVLVSKKLNPEQRKIKEFQFQQSQIKQINKYKKYIQKFIHPVTKLLIGTIELTVQNKDLFIQ